MDLLEKAIKQSQDSPTKFSIDAPVKGVWAHASPLSCPPSTFPTLNNVDLPAGVITAMGGNEVFLNGAYPVDTTPTLLMDRRTTASTDYLLAVQGAAASTGAVYKWVTNAWVLLRSGLTGIATASVWWSAVQYGSDLYISNPYDGVYRYDGNTLAPVGSLPLLQAESDEATEWSNATANTTDYQEGVQSVKVQSGNAGASSVLTYTYTTATDITAGRYQARDYLLLFSGGTDCIHFKVKFSAGSTTTITAATYFAVTDSAGKSLTWTADKWRATKSASGAAISRTIDTWQDVYCFPADASHSATFNPTIVSTFTWQITTSSGQSWMSIDDIYSIYLNTMPAVQFLAEWKNMLWGAYTTASPDALHYSPVQGPDEYSTLATFPIKSRGQSITGLHEFYTQLTVTAESSVFSLSGSAQSSTYPAYLFDQQRVSKEHGCSSHRSIVEANNKLYWWYKGMIVEYRGTGTVKLSYAMDPTLDLADMANLQYVVGDAFRSKNQIWWTWRLATPTVAATNEKILRFDYMNGAFLETAGLSTPFICQTYSSGIERLLTLNTTDRKVYRQDSTTLTFFGTNITYTVDTPPLMLDDHSLEWDYAYLLYLTNTGILTVQTRVADHLRALVSASYATIESVTQSVDGEFGKILIGDRSTLLQFRFTTTAVKFQLQFPFIIWARQHGDERQVV